MTEKVYAENKHLAPCEIRKQLKSIFHCDLIMLPWDKKEPFGHADGIVKAIDDHTVLLTNYADFDPVFAKKFEKILSQHFTVKKLSYHIEKKNKNKAADDRYWPFENHQDTPIVQSSSHNFDDVPKLDLLEGEYEADFSAIL